MAVITLLPPPVARSTRFAVRVPCGMEARQPAGDVRVELASTAADWEAALRLVADKYRERGYSGNDAELRFTPYHALPGTVVLVAKKQGQVAATFSLVADNNQLGLPLESTYPAEVKQLRARGRRIFETICLADRGLGVRDFVPTFMALIRLAWQYGLSQGAETNVITVNPRHAYFYSNVLGYQPLGPRRAYEQVQGHPAQAYYLDPARMKAYSPQVHQMIFGTPLPPAALRQPALPRHLVRQFAARTSPANRQAIEALESANGARRG